MAIMDLNPVLTPVRDLGEFIRDQRMAAQISIRGLAAKAGVSNPYLSQVERGLRRPSAEILAQIAHGLSISVESLLAKAGILETADAPDVVVAIQADAVLTERQKSALIDIYAAFRKEAQSALSPSVPDAEPDPAGMASRAQVAELAAAPPSAIEAAALDGESNAGSHPAQPHVAEPHVAERQAAVPQAAERQAAETQAAEPQAMVPKTAEPKTKKASG